MGHKNLKNHVFVKDPLSSHFYCIVEVDFEKEALAADKEYIKERWAHLQDPYTTRRPIHKYRNMIIKMDPKADVILYYGDGFEYDDKPERDTKNGETDFDYDKRVKEWQEAAKKGDDVRPADWDTSYFIKATEEDFTDILDKKWVPSSVSEYGKYLDSVEETRRITDLRHESRDDQDSGAIDNRKTAGIRYYVYATDSTFKKLIDKMVEDVFFKTFSDEPLDRDESIDSYMDSKITELIITQDYAARYKSMKAAVENKRQSLENTNINECPHIPYIGNTLFPHQALALAILNKEPRGILDVGTGGGKTIMLTADALNLMYQGKVKKPLLLMPDRTIPQQYVKIRQYTNKGINVFCIDSETWPAERAKIKVPERLLKAGDKLKISEYKEAETRKVFEERIKAAPPNTIFLSSYSWLRMGEKVGTGEFETHRDGSLKLDKKGNPVEKYEVFHTRAKWLKDCGIDYVALDESHNCKNAESESGQSIKDFATLTYKRIASGTLSPNQLTDIWNQVRFLEPTLFGSFEQFCNTFGEIVEEDRSGQPKVLKWYDDAQQSMKKLMKRLGYVSARRSHWMHLLPVRQERIWPVSLSATQQEAYELIYNGIMTFIESNKAYQDLFKQMQAVQGGDEEDLFEQASFKNLLTKLIRLDQFLTCPEQFNGKEIVIDQDLPPIKFTLPPGEEVSPKVEMAERILVEHFMNPVNRKVIIFTQHKDSADHFMKHIDWEEVSKKCGKKVKPIYYDGDHRKNLDVFLTNDSVNVICACDASIKEGLDLQIANRIIRADLRWSPGDMEQSYGRIFRPGAAKNAKVYVDILITDNTAEVTKYAQLVKKYNDIAQLDSSYVSKGGNLPPVIMNPENMKNFRHFIQLEPFSQKMKEIADTELTENENLRKKYGEDMVSGFTHPNKKLAGAKPFEVPHKRKVLEEDDAVASESESEELEEDTKAGKCERQVIVWQEFYSDEKTPHVLFITDADTEAFDISILKGVKWKHDKSFMPDGKHVVPVWYKWLKDKQSVKKMLDNLKLEGIDFKVVKGLPNSKKVKTDATGEKAVAVEDKAPDYNVAQVDLLNIDGYFYLRVPKEDDNSKDLKSVMKFAWKGRMYWYQIKSRSAALAMLVRIKQKKIKIPNLDDLVWEIKRDKMIPGNTAPIGILEQLMMKTKKGTPSKGEAKIRYALFDDKPVLMIYEAESRFNIPMLKTLGFRAEKPAYYKQLKNRQMVYPNLKRLMKAGYRLTNFDAVLRGLKRWRISSKGLEGLKASNEAIQSKKTAWVQVKIGSLLERLERYVGFKTE